MLPQRLRSIIAAGLCVILLFTGVAGLFGIPNVAHAQENVVGEFTKCFVESLGEIAISAALIYFGLIVPTVDIPAVIKENIKDCLAWVIANEALEEITAEVIEYVNTGLDGNPVYVTSLNQELQRTADETFVNFIESGELNELSPSFRNDITFAMIKNYNMRNDFRGRMASTLDEELYDIPAYLSGDFSQGGWSTFYKLTQEPQNNIYGAHILVQDEINRRISSRVENKQVEIQAGRGFLNKQKCSEVELGSKQEYEYNEIGEIIGTIEVPVTETQCVTVTPGSVIQESLQRTLGVGIDRIIQADEFNEALSLLFSGLVSTVLSSEEGLTGIGEFVEESSGFIGLELGGGGSADWNCLHEFSGQPASKSLSVNLGDAVGGSGGGGGFGIKKRITGTEVGKFYRTAVIDFDLTINKLSPSGNGFTSFSDFARSSIVGTYAGYWGTGISQNNGMKTYLDRHGSEFTSQSAQWAEGQTYHITITHDAQAGTVNLKSDAGHNHTFTYTFGVDIADTGDGLFLYFPDFQGGNEARNISVTLEPGGPYNGGVRGPCSGGQLPPSEIGI